MNLVKGKPGLIFRLGAMFAALLLGQQAIAAGTRAGTDIENTASVDYFVGGVDQADIPSNTVTFVVDRRVDFDLVALGSALVEVAPGETNAWFDFLLTNDSNSDLDFTIDLAQLVGDLVRGVSDDGTMATVDYAVNSVSENNQPGTPVDPARNGAQFVDELAADDSIRIRVFGDAAAAMANGQVAGVQLDATAGTPGTSGVEGVALVDTTDTDAGIDNVFADEDNDGVESDVDGFIVAAAQLSVVKAYTVIDDGFGGTENPLPGAEVEYTITITNATGAATADNVVITDTLDDDLAFLPDALVGGADMTLTVDGGAATGCTEEGPDNDGCARSGQALTFNVVSIAADGELIVTYRVTILDPAATPPATP